jgi:5-methylcytosine-specific restriction protein A
MKLAKLTRKIATLQPQRKREPWQRSPVAAKRLTGRRLQERNFRIKLRDRFTCQCGCGRVGPEHELEVDHRVPMYEGGTEDDSNLQSLLIECHARKSQTERNRVSAKCTTR